MCQDPFQPLFDVLSRFITVLYNRRERLKARWTDLIYIGYIIERPVCICTLDRDISFFGELHQKALELQRYYQLVNTLDCVRSELNGFMAKVSDAMQVQEGILKSRALVYEEPMAADQAWLVYMGEMEVFLSECREHLHLQK